MTSISIEYKNIYTTVEARIDEVLRGLSSSPKESKLHSEYEKTIAVLKPHSFKLKSEIRALEENAEWNTFVMAFYGETNAGKSTIIETLRIILKERSKVKERELFSSIQKKFNITDQRFSELHTAIEFAESESIQAQTNLLLFEKNHLITHQSEVNSVSALQKKIEEVKTTASLWKKLIWIFKEMAEIGELKKLEESIHQHSEIRRQELALLKRKAEQATRNKQGSLDNLQKAEVEKKNLEQYADGNIIGNGKSDFTTKTHEYRFAAHDQEFILLDVPGIEGNESLVIDSVQGAVKKAHAVFYVTGKAAPPQKGEDGQKGTLEKIKEHLNSQTEVWTIFNKRVTNPLQIENGLSIGDDEQQSLDDLDKKMSEQLQDHYKGTLALSAYPAFLAAANHLVPGSHHWSGKEKFSKKFNGNDILNRTKMNDFYRFITVNLVRNAKLKISHSNFSKAKFVVSEAEQAITQIVQQTMMPLQEKLKKESEHTIDQIDGAFEALQSRISSSSDRGIEKFVENLREKMYSIIESDVDNDTFKSQFEYQLKLQQEQFASDFPLQIQAETKRFELKIVDVLDRYKEIAQDSIDAYSHLTFNGIEKQIDLKIDIKNGINVPSLIAAAIGGALMIWNPAGWVVIAAGALGIVISVVKAVRGFFSSTYRKSQQREAVSANLSDITRAMHASMRTSFENAFLNFEPKIEQLAITVREPALSLSTMIDALHQTEQHFKSIVADIDKKITALTNQTEDAAGVIHIA